VSIADEHVDAMLEDLDDAGGAVRVRIGGCEVLGVPRVVDADAFRGSGSLSRARVESVVVKTGALEDLATGATALLDGEERRVAGHEALGDGTTRIDLAFS